MQLNDLDILSLLQIRHSCSRGCIRWERESRKEQSGEDVPVAEQLVKQYSPLCWLFSYF